MECLIGSCQIILFLFSSLIGIQALYSSFFSPSSLGAAAPCRPDQKSDLLQFMSAMMPNNSTYFFHQMDSTLATRPKMLSWNADTDCCSWEGVMCDQMTGHVIRLELGCCTLNPTCYSSVGSSDSTKLSSLGSFNLSSPHKAERPSWSNSDMLLQNLTMLKILTLDGLNMSGIDVSRLMNLSPSLEVLSLSSCKLRGTLAANIFLLPKLTCLNLSGNKDLAGYLPESTWNSSLKVLDLSSTGFSGVLPESIGDLHSLEILWLYQCNFSGSIPSSLGNLTRLTILELSFNELGGQVPPTQSNLNRLTLLDLSSNNFVGPIPNVFDNKTQLQKLLFSNNYFAGLIPPSIKNLSNLAQLDISHNLIGGSIPSSLFSLPSLTSLDLSNDGLSGHIGEFLAAPSLDHVDLSGNQLGGSIPSSIFQLGNLTYLSISANNLTGVLDLRLLSRLRSLTDLDLSDNILSLSNSKNADHVLPNLSKVSLSGCKITAIPGFLRNSTSMEWMDLSRNKIHGDIPPWMWDVGIRSFSYLNVSHNFLTSFKQVPWENLVVLDLNSNLIQGPFLPPSLPNSVLIFSLARNQVSGYIPGSICEMKGLQILDLSHNNFTGTIPRCLANISDSLLVLDLQENGLSGTISLIFSENAVLRSLHLNGNKFEGLLPHSLINCKQLELLDLSGNNLSDTFPKWLEALPILRVLLLQSNRLHGSISNPGTEFPFPQLRILNLSSNELTGTLPSAYIVNLKAMMSIDQDGSEYAEATLPHSMTVVVENTMNEELYPRLVYADGSPGAPGVDYPQVPSKSTSPISMETDRPWLLFFATECTLDGWGHPVSCGTGDCGEGRCTLVEQPVATRILYDHGTVKVTTEYGYNCGLNGIFLCVDCDCPSFSCVIDLDRCPEHLRVRGDSGSVVACKPGVGLPSGQNCPAPSSYSVPPSAGATCPSKNVIR